MQYRPLGKTGLNVSALSFGASSLGAVFHDIKEDDAIRTVHLAVERGVNFVDVSPFYGLTKAETLLGKAIKSLPREKYILATKVGRYGQESKDFDFSASRVTRSVDESLRRMGLEHIDVIQCHDIEFGSLDQIVNETVPALHALKKSGKVRFVGVTGLPLVALRRVVERVPVDVILSYCHYELNDTALMDLVPLLNERGVGVISASPLGMGLLSSRGSPDWHPAPDSVKAVCATAAAHCRARGGSIEKLAVQYAIAEPAIATTLVGTADSKNMEKNLAAVEQPMNQRLLEEVLGILKPIHNVTWESGRPENNGE